MDKVKAQSNHYPSLFSSILFILGALFLLGLALVLGMTTLVSLFTGAEVGADQTVPLVAFGFEAIVLLAAAFFSLQKFFQKPSADEHASVSVSTWQILLLGFVAGVSLLIGYQIGEMKSFLWIILPILTVPAIVFPLGVLLVFGTRKLPFGTRWQTWSVLGLAMTLGPLILFTLEIFIGLIIFAFVVAYLVTQPELAQELQRLSQEIMILGPESEAALELLGPLLTRPGVMAVTLIYIAVLVPAIEEIFKPIGVWLFAGQLTPAQGLTLGALSGAGYALIETIGVSAQTSEWASLLFSRIGTGLLHITTSALMGAAIVLARREGRYLRLIGTYFLAVFLHGLWNSLAIIFTFSTLAELFEQPGTLGTIQSLIIVAMVVLVIALFAILVISNLRMRKTISPSFVAPTVPSDSIEISKTM
jgi:hypothetical protein